MKGKTTSILRRMGIDKREDKISRIATWINNNQGKSFKLTPMAKNIGIHVNSLKDTLDSWQVIKDAGKMEIVRDSKDRIMLIKILEENNPNSEKELIELRRELLDIKATLSEINQKIKRKK